MPDISMCSTTECPLAASCYRSPKSGTRPVPRRQPWMSFTFQSVPQADDQSFCAAFWPTRGESATCQ